MNKKVGISRCGSYDVEELYQALKVSASAAGIPDVAGKKLLLKPNILADAAPERAITTHPVFLEAVIRLVREWGAARILVGDSPGIQPPNFTARASGLRDAALKNGAEWVDFTRGKVDLECPQAKIHRHFSVTAVHDDVDCIINLPKLKTHQLMFFTGAMKNIFGLIPSLNKTPFHVRYPLREDFAAMIVDLNQSVKPVYTFMDAVVAMEGPGPGSGSPRPVGLVLASSNVLAVDAAACSIIGYPQEKIPVNREALARGVWLKDFSEIDYPLLKPEAVRIPDFVKIPFKKSGNQLLDFLTPKPLRKLRERLKPRPRINHKVCVRCSDCVRICASGALSLAGENGSKQIELNAKNCIGCYCCHEVCPAKAIEV